MIWLDRNFMEINYMPRLQIIYFFDKDCILNAAKKIEEILYECKDQFKGILSRKEINQLINLNHNNEERPYISIKKLNDNHEDRLFHTCICQYDWEKEGITGFSWGLSNLSSGSEECSKIIVSENNKISEVENCFRDNLNNLTYLEMSSLKDNLFSEHKETLIAIETYERIVRNKYKKANEANLSQINEINGQYEWALIRAIADLIVYKTLQYAENNFSHNRSDPSYKDSLNGVTSHFLGRFNDYIEFHANKILEERDYKFEETK